MTQPPVDVVAVLRDFDNNPVRAGHSLRTALRSNRGALLGALADEGVFNSQQEGLRFALNLLLGSDVAIYAIATPSVTSFVQALRLTRYLLELDGNFIATLVTALLIRDDLADPACALRVLDLVSECASHLANWRPLLQVHADGDNAVKARCAALLARRRFGDESGLEEFRKSKPRIRANIVQNFWHGDQDKANAILETALQDADNRVAGNACLALYNCGDTRALIRLAEMLESPDPRNKITAAWVIGRCRDARFASGLRRALRSDLPPLRKHALASLARLEPVQAPAPGAPVSSDDLDLCFVSAPQAAPDAGYELWLHVARQEGELVTHLRPADFFVWASGEFLLDYSVRQTAQTPAAALRIVYPAGHALLEGAFAASLAKKPAEQCWAIGSYGRAPAKPSPAVDSRFEADGAALASLLESGPVVSADPMDGIKKVLIPESVLAEQHLVLLLDGSAIAVEPVRLLCEERKIRFHCWRLTSNTDENDPAAVFRTEEQSAAVWPRFVAAIAARYTLHAGRCPHAVAVRNATVKPARFSARVNLLKGGQNA